MLIRSNPIINEYVVNDVYDNDDFVDLKADSFAMAFLLTDFAGVPKSDPRYVKWVGSFYSSQGDTEETIALVKMRPCSEEDLKQFYPPDLSISSTVETYKETGVL